MASSRRASSNLPVVTVQSRRYFGINVAAARDELDAVVLADGQELDRDDGGERNAAEQGFVRSGSLPRLANFTSAAGTLFCAR